MYNEKSAFEWDPAKDARNRRKHGVDFDFARRAFFDERRVIFEDAAHSALEPRWFCLGKVEGRVLTVRFTLRGETIRILGAGWWRKGRKAYEEENPL